MLYMSCDTPGTGLLLPNTESVRADGTVGGGCHEVSAGMEVTMDECVSE